MEEIDSRPQIRPLRGRLTHKMGAWLDRHQPPETAVLMGTALLVGLGAGLGAVVFRWLIDTVQDLFFDALPAAVPALGDWVLVLAPALPAVSV